MHVSKPAKKAALLPDDLAQEGGFSSGVPKMLDAILFFRVGCSFGSSKPKEKLEPPPGGRSTLQRDAALQPAALSNLQRRPNMLRDPCWLL